MLTYRATIRPRGVTRSPWQADTLFGHLCWLIRYEEGEQALKTFLEPYRAGQPPLLFSDGFPSEYLPRPLLPRPFDADTHQPKHERVTAMQEAKQDKDIRWVSMAEFNALRRNPTTQLEARESPVVERAVLKNSINRLTGGTTPLDDDAGGNLYAVHEIGYATGDAPERTALPVSIYVRAVDDRHAERARDLLARLARSGYGARKSAGYGHFALDDWQPFAGFDDLPDANGFISLSNWVPAHTDPTDGYYTTTVKYGKLGEEWANAANPFKFPLIMLAAGSSFRTGAPPAEWYGRLVKDIAPGKDEVVHYGYALAVPALLADDHQ